MTPSPTPTSESAAISEASAEITHTAPAGAPGKPTLLTPSVLPSATPLPAVVPAPTAETIVSIRPDAVAAAAPWVCETTVTILTCGYEQGFQATQPDDPIYPYPRLDFSLVGSPTPRRYRAVVLENGYVSLTILPELGGRIYGWLDKATGRQLLYQNPVIKPTSWGYRGWWLAAGGIEWAFPVEEHGLNEWRTWKAAVGNSAYGLSVTVSDVEDRTGMQVGATISLDTYHAYVTVQPWVRNDTNEPHRYQLWLNAMLSLAGNHVSRYTQFIIPTDQVLIHSAGDSGLPGAGGWMRWPFFAGRDMSRYGNWGSHLGFFVPSVTAGFTGLYDPSTDQGVVRVYSPGWPAGTKLFGPAGLDPSLWTDDESGYVELWSGATGSFWSDAVLQPGESFRWREHWFPVSGLGGFSYANRSAALRLDETDAGAEIGAAVSGSVSGAVKFWVGGQLVENWPVSLSPGAAFRAQWTRSPDAEGGLGLQLTDSGGAVVAQVGQITAN